MDILVFMKVEVVGLGVEVLFDCLVVNKLLQKVGGIMFIYMLNKCGWIELEIIVVKLEEG